MNELLVWYRANRRDLPWRSSPSPYAVWVSEVMLQQTQVATVIDYFNRWMERFPTVESLAAASTDEVLSSWQGLGYYRRARSLHEGAQVVSRNGFPVDAAGWLALPGVGRYTAGAITSIALGQPEPLVDGNVERVYARLTTDSSTGPALTRNAWRWAADNLDRSSSGDWNQGLMELGATVCTPANPKCPTCPVTGRCEAYRTNRVGKFPIRPMKKSPTQLTHHLWIPVWENKIGVQQVPAGEWWAGMWSFPRAISITDLESMFPNVLRQEVGTLKHSVTTHRIQLIASVITTDSALLRWLSPDELQDIGIPAPHRKALQLAQSSGLASS